MDSAESLPPPVWARLRAGTPVLALSASADGDPHSTYSWAAAIDGRRLRFAVDRGSTTSAHLRATGRGAIVVVGTGGANLLLGGRARLLQDRIEAAPELPLELWELRIARVKDQSWPGVTTSELGYRWPVDRRAEMERIEQAVFAAMRQEPPVRPGR